MQQPTHQQSPFHAIVHATVHATSYALGEAKCALGKVQTETAGASPYRLWEFLLPGISRPASKAQPTGLVFVA